MSTSEAEKPAPKKWFDLRRHLRREPIMLALLSALAVTLFLAVTGLSRRYYAQQEALGNRWFSRGTADLKAQRLDRAVNEFRAALIYSRDDYAYQLNLAEALLGEKRTNEAYAYLVNLWDRQPENGLVNLELARIAAQRGETEQVLRYYHDAIYATWPDDEQASRRDARLELIEFLLSNNADAQAQAEMIALAANLGDDTAEQVRVGNLFVRVQDYEHALAAFRTALKSDRHNVSALAGAGLTAFELGRYPAAYRYLQGAAAANPEDAQIVTLLKTTDLVLQMDPFQPQISADHRNWIVVTAFTVAGERLKACSAGNAPSSSESVTSLTERWRRMKPKINPEDLKNNPDLADSAMDLIFDIERQTSATCGSPAGTDLALLLIAKLHEGN